MRVIRRTYFVKRARMPGRARRWVRRHQRRHGYVWAKVGRAGYRTLYCRCGSSTITRLRAPRWRMVG